MNRSSKSFLDDLLGDAGPGDGGKGSTASSKATPSSSKSVRFLAGDDDDDILGSFLPKGPPATRPSTGQQHQQHQNLNPNAGSQAASSGGNLTPNLVGSSASGADWLGLSGSTSSKEPDHHQPPRTPQSHEGSRIPFQPVESTVTSGPSWLDPPASSSSSTAASRASVPMLAQVASQVQMSTYSGAGNMATNSPPHMGLSPSSLPLGSTQLPIAHASSSPSSSGPIVTDGRSIQVSPPESVTHSSSPEVQILLLQTQLKVLELEKNNLLSALDKTRRHHDDETKLMKQLYEKQMEMTKSFLSDQELMSVEEKDRRIEEMNKQLINCHEEKEGLMQRYKDKVAQVMKDREEEITLLKETHKGLITRLQEEHEEDMYRVRRLKDEGMDTVTSLHQHKESLESLVIQWKDTMSELGNLHKDTVTNSSSNLGHIISEDRVTSLLKSLEGMTLREEEMHRQLMAERKDQEEKEGERIKLDREIERLNLEKRQLDQDRDRSRDRESAIDRREQDLSFREGIFRGERDKLTQLAGRLNERAIELESLSFILGKEKRESDGSARIMTQMRAEVDQEGRVMREKEERMGHRERELAREKIRMRDQWGYFMQVKDHILCSLCNASLAHARVRGIGFHPDQLDSWFPSPPPPIITHTMDNKMTTFFSGHSLPAPSINRMIYEANQGDVHGHDGHGEGREDALHVYQIWSQKEAALLAEESAFLDEVKQGNLILTNHHQQRGTAHTMCNQKHPSSGDSIEGDK